MKRPSLILLLSVLGILFAACSVKHRVAVPGPVTSTPQSTIVGISTNAGDQVDFDAPATIQGDKLLARVKHKPYEIPLANIQRYWIETRTFSATRTVGLIAGVGAAAAIAVLVAVHSDNKPKPVTTCAPNQACGCCLYVYSWDGQRYDFDTETFTGAITRGLERDDFSLLQKVRPQDGEYRVLLSNDNDETQFTDQVELWVVDHPRGETPRTGADGVVHSLTQMQPLLTARDGEGKDLTAWLSKRDGLIWEPAPAAQRQEIALTFAKPGGASQAKLITSATFTPWAGEVAGKMLGLLGPQLPAWYQQVDSNPLARAQLVAWMARDELYALKIEVEEADGWKVRGMLPIAGPFVSDERIVPLDLSHVQGDQVHVRMRPPSGFWAFNSFAMDYSTDHPMHVTRLEPMRARDAAGHDLLPALCATDGKYYEMQQMGEQATVAFAAPPATPGMERTLFLHSRGYYRMHVPDNPSPNAAEFQKILNEPGEGAAFAAQTYAAKNH